MKVHLKIFYKLLIFHFIFSYSISFTQQISNESEISIISPSKNKVLNIDRREGILWTTADTSRIDIEYSIDEDNWIRIFGDIKADLEYLGWKVPAKLAEKKIKLRIINSNSKQNLAETDYWIHISNIYQRNSVLKSNIEGNKLKILPLGNSITFDKRNRETDKRDVDDRIGYRFPLFQLFNSSPISINFIGSEYAGSNFFFPDTNNAANAGFPGITDNQLAELLKTGILDTPRLSEPVTITTGPYLETYLPDIILLHIGTNGNDLTNGQSADDIETILDEIDRVEVLLGKKIDVLVARIINRSPVEDFVTSFNDNVEEMIFDRINNRINSDHPEYIKIVDMESGAGLSYEISADDFINGVAGEPGDMHDQVHPNDKGYAKMAQVWFDGIIDILPKLSVKIYLEGAYTGLNSMSSGLNLENSQPFNTSPWNYGGTELLYETPNGIIDWVLVSLREDLSESSEVARRAGLLKSDGTIVDLDGTTPLVFVIHKGEYFVVIEHRNHLPIISSTKVLW